MRVSDEQLAELADSLSPEIASIAQELVEYRVKYGGMAEPESKPIPVSIQLSREEIEQMMKCSPKLREVIGSFEQV